MDAKLLPCPFCGETKASTYFVRDGRVAMCPACGAKAGSQFNGPHDQPSADERAIAAWNTRAPTPDATLLAAEMRDRTVEIADLCDQQDGGLDSSTGRYIADEIAALPLPSDPLAAALALPEIAGLMEAVREAADAIDMAYGDPHEEDDRHRYSRDLRAALARLTAPTDRRG